MSDGESRGTFSAPGLQPQCSPSRAAEAGSYGATPIDDKYRLRIVTRCRVAQMRLVPGQTLWLAPDKLRVAAHLVACGTGRPADEHTATAVELYELLNR